MFDRLRKRGFDLLVSNHAEAILSVDFSEQVAELVDALLDFSLPMAEIIGSGGGEAPSTQRLRRRLADANWIKHNFMVETKIDGETREAVSHEIDRIRRCENGVIAMEIEWNNKDPFFDRDLENFQRLHAQSVISLGIIVTRGAAMQETMSARIADFLRREAYIDADRLIALGMKRRTDRQDAALNRLIAKGVPFPDAFAKTFVADKFGQATTHWSKLADRVARGVGNPCPLLLIGLPSSVIAG